MNFAILGRTGLKVSRMGLGCGGHSRLGQSYGRSEAESINVVREALELGINFIDTAEGYGTETIVGKAVAGVDRDEVVISTKVHTEKDGIRSRPAEFKSRVEAGLTRLGVDYVDILHIHGLSSAYYPYAKANLVPVLQKLREEGKIRFIGVTEAFAPDPRHEMFALAQEDDFWDVVMIGFNILNQSARERVLPWTREKSVGTLCMFAVRAALSKPERLQATLDELVKEGAIDGPAPDLNALIKDCASSLTEAAYRFCLHEPGMDVILSGTGNIEHLKENFRSLSMPALPEEVTRELRKIFERVDSVSGN